MCGFKACEDFSDHVKENLEEIKKCIHLSKDFKNKPCCDNKPD
jgi:hypothetical protein